MIPETALTLPIEPGVDLEARMATPPGARAGLAIGHPHPLYGGDMDNPVVVRGVEVAAAAGLATIRFNFRGVGASTGTHGGGTAEERDLEGAIAALRGALPADAAIVAAGYSFGSVVAAQVAARGGIRALALIAPPLGLDRRPLPALPADLHVLVAVGSLDEYCPTTVVERLRHDLPHATIKVIEGANHFFFGKLFPLGEGLRGWLERVLDGRSGTATAPG